jgi:hypothetical protein
MRRYTRLSNSFSRKIENHMAAVALNYFAYNFIKIHTTLLNSARTWAQAFEASAFVCRVVRSECP